MKNPSRTIRRIVSIEEAKAFNKKIYECRSASSFNGCIAELACEKCGAILSDSICLCGGIGTCDNCGYEEPRFPITILKGMTLFSGFDINGKDVRIDYMI